MTNTFKAFAIALTLAAGIGGVSLTASAADGGHWAYPSEFVGR